jgi:hypothetical protein
MRFLEQVEIEEWCGKRGFVVENRDVEMKVADLPHLTDGLYANGRASGGERATAEDCVMALGDQHETFVWIRDWGVWGSGEDWPAFYAWPGAQNERRSLTKAPGHLFGRDETKPLLELLTHILFNAWDAVLIAQDASDRTLATLRISHDEWLEIFTREPRQLPRGVRPFTRT